MKPILFLLTTFVVLTSFAAAQSKRDPFKPRHKEPAPVTAPQAPKITGLPTHHGSSVSDLRRSAKAGSVDAQLNQLERRNAKLARGRATSKKSPSLASSNPKAGGNKPINFQYRPPKGGTTSHQSATASSRKGYSIGHRVGR